MQNFTWAASAMQRAFAAIPAVELAYYASLAAMLMLFFAHCGEVHAFEDFVLILAVAVFVSFDATRRLPVLPIPLPVACGCDRIRAGLWQPPKASFVREQMALTSVGRGFGLPLRSDPAARNTHTTILELPLQR